MSKEKELTLTQKLQYKIPYKWKIQSFNADKTKASCVAYIDARAVMDLLDRAVGVRGWQDRYRRDSQGRLICRIELFIDGRWVGKEDTGVAGDYEKEKSEFSDAFKRAAVKWGVGRFLYDLNIEWVDVNKNKKPVYPHSGKRIWNLTKYINSKKKHGK